MKTYTLSIACQDQKGLIFKITEKLLQHDLNIVCNDEFVDNEKGKFFMRTEFSGTPSLSVLKTEILAVLPPNAQVELNEFKKKNIVLLATKESHCLGDLLMRLYSQDINANILAVIANHHTLEDLVTRFKIPFVCVSHENKTREEHETEMIRTIQQFSPDFVVLAKYMRILSPNFIQHFPNKIINIHHSFLPAFIGARPYEQAYRRGVKIIGATAHFVTEELDQGPIIAQNIIPVNHRYSAHDMAQAGRDVEKIVLANALNLVLDERVFIDDNKTIIFE